MKIVAFLQCAWFHNPAAVQAAIERQAPERRLEYRQRFLARALFAGCNTGRRLKDGLGMPLCNRIIWEEASTQLGEEASAVFPPDMEHIRSVLESFQPEVVVAFGAVARDALRQLGESDDSTGRLLIAPHPSSRQQDLKEQLAKLKEELEFRIAHHENQ